MNTTNVSAPALLMGVLCASTAGQAETIRNFTGLNYWDEERAFEGYTLFGAQGNATTYLLDMEGNVVHSWPISGNPRLPDSSAQTGLGENIVLGRPTDESVVVHVLAEEGTGVFAEFGQVSGSLAERTVTLESSDPGTRRRRPAGPLLHAGR